MKYERIERATFLERPNRFIAYARIAGKQETIHVKNTGRCAELLVPEAEIFVQESDNPERKTKWDLIGVRKGNRLINMDSQVTNKVVQEKHLTTLMVTHNLRHAVEYGDRLLMMHQGHVIMDKAGDEKRALKVDDLLDVFTSISIECGN